MINIEREKNIENKRNTRDYDNFISRNYNYFTNIIRNNNNNAKQ